MKSTTIESDTLQDATVTEAEFSRGLRTYDIVRKHFGDEAAEALVAYLTSFANIRMDLIDFRAAFYKQSAETNSRLAYIENKVNSVEYTLNLKIDKVEQSLNDKIDRVEERLNDKIDKVKEHSDNNFNILNAKIDNVEKKLNDKIDRVEERLNDKIDRVEERLNDKIDKVEERLNDKIDRVEERLNAKITEETTKIRIEVKEGFLAMQKQLTNIQEKNSKQFLSFFITIVLAILGMFVTMFLNKLL